MLWDDFLDEVHGSQIIVSFRGEADSDLCLKCLLEAQSEIGAIKNSIELNEILSF